MLAAVLFKLQNEGFSNKRDRTYPRQAVFAMTTKNEVFRNSYTINTVYPRGNALHAEWNLLAHYNFKAPIAIYIIRVRRDLSLAPIHPCQCCKNILRECGCKLVISLPTMEETWL